MYRHLKQVGEYQELVCDPNQSEKILSVLVFSNTRIRGEASLVGFCLVPLWEEQAIKRQTMILYIFTANMCVFKRIKRKKKSEEQAPLVTLLERLVAFSVLWTEAETGLGKGRHLFFFCNVQLVFLIPIAHGGGIESVLKFFLLQECSRSNNVIHMGVWIVSPFS